MMKKFRTIVAASLAAIAAFGVTACGGKKAATEKEDPTKTYLDVGVFDAGLGTAYFDALKKDFEAYYADKSFETGKQGVVVRALKKSTEFNPANLVNSMKNYEPIIVYSRPRRLRRIHEAESSGRRYRRYDRRLSR